MAVKTFEDIYGSLSADQKKLLDNTFSEHPELKEGWLRQDDYSRNMTEMKAKESTYKEAVDYKEKMEPWAESAYERIKRLEEAGVVDNEGNVLWEAQKAELERQLNEAKNGLGGDMDPAELEKRVKAIVKESGLNLTKEEIAAVAASQMKTLAEETFKSQWATKETEFNTKTIPFVSGFATSLALAASKFEKETGRDFTDDDQKAVYDLMSKTQNFNPRKAVEEYMKPLLEESKKDAEIKRLSTELEAAKRGMPGGGNESFIPHDEAKSGLRLLMEQGSTSGTPAPTDDFEASIMQGAAQGAAELRAGK